MQVQMSTYKKSCRADKTKFVTNASLIHTTVGRDGVRVDGERRDCVSDFSDAFKNAHHNLVLASTVATVDLGQNRSLQVSKYPCHYTLSLYHFICR